MHNSKTVTKTFILNVSVVYKTYNRLKLYLDGSFDAKELQKDMQEDNPFLAS